MSTFWTMSEGIRYVYYRVNRLFRRLSGPDKRYCHYNAMAFVCVCLLMNIHALAFIVAYYAFGISSMEVINFMRNGKGFSWPLILVILASWWCLSVALKSDDSFYRHFEKKYKNEKYRNLKGGLIVVYTILSVMAVILIPYIEKMQRGV